MDDSHRRQWLGIVFDGRRKRAYTALLISEQRRAVEWDSLALESPSGSESPIRRNPFRIYFTVIRNICLHSMDIYFDLALVCYIYCRGCSLNEIAWNCMEDVGKVFCYLHHLKKCIKRGGGGGEIVDPRGLS